MSHIDEVLTYCNQIVQGKILAGRYCILSVKRFLSDIEKSKKDNFPYVLINESADEVIDFAESLVIPDIEASEDNPEHKLKLLPWMKFIYYNLFGWKNKNDNNKRRFDDAYIELARKNSKTTSILFPLILYDFLTTNAAESYFVSKDLKQSETCYKEMQQIIKADKDLFENLEMNSETLTFKSSRISFFCDGSEGIDAYKNSLSVIDEYHAYDSDRIVTAFRYGGRARKNRLTIKITSAGNDISKPCYMENQSAKNLLEGLAENEHQFCIIYAYDSGDDWKNPELFKKANPSMDELPVLTKDVLMNDLFDALQKPSHQPDFITKTCGIWSTYSSDWIPIFKFKDYQKPINFKLYDKEPCALALDMAEVNDIAVLTKCFRSKESQGFAFMHNFYVPDSTIQERYEKENINFKNWIDNGIITATPGETTDKDWIYSDIEETIKNYSPICLYYDPWHTNELIKKIEENYPKLLLVPFSQSLKSMSPVTKDYEEEIYKQRIFDPNPVIEWMLGNVNVKPDTNGNYKPLKKSKASNCRIDGIVSSIMALAGIKENKIIDKKCKDFKTLINSF